MHLYDTVTELVCPISVKFTHCSEDNSSLQAWCKICFRLWMFPSFLHHQFTFYSTFFFIFMGIKPLTTTV